MNKQEKQKLLADLSIDKAREWKKFWIIEIFSAIFFFVMYFVCVKYFSSFNANEKEIFTVVWIGIAIGVAIDVYNVFRDRTIAIDSPLRYVNEDKDDDTVWEKLPAEKIVEELTQY